MKKIITRIIEIIDLFISKLTICKLAVLILSCYNVTAICQEEVSVCDKSIKVQESHPWAYKQRGNRCEGIYVKQVNTSLLRIVSYTRGFEKYSFESGELLKIKWYSYANSENINLRSQSLKPREYYQMDTQQEIANSYFTWPPNLLKAIDIYQRNLGVLGWTILKIGDTERKVYMPLMVWQNDTIKLNRISFIKVLPGREITELYLSIKPLEQNGKLGDFLVEEKPFTNRSFPAGQAFPVPISELDSSGIYSLELKVVFRDNNVHNLDFFIYYLSD